MGEEGPRDREPAAPVFVGPPPPPIQPWTARVDAAWTELDTWGRALAGKYTIGWNPPITGEGRQLR